MSSASREPEQRPAPGAFWPFIGAIALARGAWAAALLLYLHRTRGFLSSSVDEILRQRDALRYARGPLLAVPPIEWDPPGFVLLLGSVFRVWSDHPYLAGLAIAAASTVVGTLAAGFVAWRLSGRATAGLLLGAAFYSGAGLLNFVGLMPGLPQGLLTASYVAAIAACLAALDAPGAARWLLATIALAVVTSTRYEGAAFAGVIAGFTLGVLAVRPDLRARSRAWRLLPLFPLPLLALVASRGFVMLAGRMERLAADTLPGDLEILDRYGAFAWLWYVGRTSPAILVVGLAGVAGLAASTLRGRERFAPGLLLAALGAPLALYGYLFVQRATGVVTMRLNGPVAAILAIAGAVLVARLHGAVRERWGPRRAHALALAAACTVALLENRALLRSTGSYYTELYEGARILHEAGLWPLVEQKSDGDLMSALVGTLAADPRAEDLAIEHLPGDLVELVRTRVAPGQAGLLLHTPGAVAAAEEAARDGRLAGRLIVLSQKRWNRERWALVLPPDAAAPEGRWVSVLEPETRR